VFTTLQSLSQRAVRIWRDRGVLIKAMSFAAIGVVNAVIDASVFFLAYMALGSFTPFVGILGQIADLCGCGGVATIRLVVANIVAWLVAVSGSYVMNSYITFAAESGRQLRWRAYLAFAASGVAGLIANTVVLVAAAQAMPVWAAKGLAILASFTVNFSLSHFVVFRAQSKRSR
jgi:putative flippase GtrA